MSPSVLKYIMRAPLTPADLEAEHPALAQVHGLPLSPSTTCPPPFPS
jgi:hypothetical protein